MLCVANNGNLLDLISSSWTPRPEGMDERRDSHTPTFLLTTVDMTVLLFRPCLQRDKTGIVSKPESVKNGNTIIKTFVHVNSHKL